MTPSALRNTSAVVQGVAPSRVSSSPGELLRFNFASFPAASSPARRTDKASSLREAIARWLDQRL